MKTFTNNPVLRWIAVLPAALLAAIMALFPWHWVVIFFADLAPMLFGVDGLISRGYEEGAEPFGISSLVRAIGPEEVETLGNGFIIPFVLIVVAAKIAPKYKIATGRVVVLLLVALIVFLHTPYANCFLYDCNHYAIGLRSYFYYTSVWVKLYAVLLVTLWVTGTYSALRFNNVRYSTD